jgi:hypothetical protein
MEYHAGGTFNLRDQKLKRKGIGQNGQWLGYLNEVTSRI